MNQANINMACSLPLVFGPWAMDQGSLKAALPLDL
jgi:hypothetical protein